MNLESSHFKRDQPFKIFLGPEKKNHNYLIQ